MNKKVLEIITIIVNALTETLHFLEMEAEAMVEEKEAEDCENNVSNTLVGDAVEDSTVAEFLKEMLPLLTWDLVPFSFLYDLYRAWMQKWYPNKDLIDRKDFVYEVRHLANIWGDEWICSRKLVESSGRMEDPERLIFAYDLRKWKNPEYEGNNIDKICRPELKPAYHGLLRKSVAKDDCLANLMGHNLLSLQSITSYYKK